MTSVVSVDDIPVIGVDPVTLDDAAVRLRKAVAGIGPSTLEANTAWSGLREVYDVAGTGTLMSHGAVVEQAGADVTEAVTTAATAIQTLAESLAAAKRRCDALHEEIPAHRQAVSWYRAEQAEQWGVQDGSDVSLWGYGQWETNNTLATECAKVQRFIDQAIDDCVTTLDRIPDVPVHLNYALGATGSVGMGVLGATHIGTPMVTFNALHDTFVDTIPATEAYRQSLVTNGQNLITAMLNGGQDDVDMEALTLVLEHIGDDPELASEFWTELGGRDTREFFARLSDPTAHDYGEYGPALAVATAARASLAKGSREWSPHQAQTFVNSLADVDGAAVPSLAPLDVITFVFADVDNAGMGVNFSSAMATYLDSVERNPDPYAHHMAQLSYRPESNPLLNPEAFGETSEAVIALDPMALVLESLGRYPDEALAWIADSSADTFDAELTTGEARISYWYGVRDWPADRWEGAAALWEGAMVAEGGVHSGATEGEAYTQQANITAGVIGALGARDAVDVAPEDLSNQAAASMAHALTGALPWLVETAIVGSENDDDRPLVELQFFSAGDLLEMPSPAVGDVSRVWGTVGGNDDGLVVLSEAAHQYQTFALAQASNGDDTGVTWEHALERYLLVDGFHQGSLGGVEEVQARIQDEEFEARIEAAGTLTGMVRLPFADRLPELGAWAYEQTVALVVDGAGDAAIATWGNQLAVAERQSNLALVAGRDVNDVRLRALWSSGAPGLREQAGDESFANWRQSYLGDYSRSYKAALLDVGRVDAHRAYDAATAGEEVQ